MSYRRGHVTGTKRERKPTAATKARTGQLGAAIMQKLAGKTLAELAAIAAGK